MTEENKPKFRVGEALIDKENPNLGVVIKGIDIINGKYIIDDIYYGQIHNTDYMWSFRFIEFSYTLNLNHYIKSL